jgi:hypothetical protein
MTAQRQNSGARPDCKPDGPLFVAAGSLQAHELQFPLVPISLL